MDRLQIRLAIYGAGKLYPNAPMPLNQRSLRTSLCIWLWVPPQQRLSTYFLAMPLFRSHVAT